MHPFCEVAGELKTASGLSFTRLAARTRELDHERRGLSASYVTQLFNGKLPPVPRALRLIAAAMDVQPDVFVEYRLHEARRTLDETVDFAAAVSNLGRLERLAAAGTATLVSPANTDGRAGRQRQLRTRA